jgi:hypothetical protein
MQAGRVGHSATLLTGDEVLLVGGGDVEVDLVKADLYVPTSGGFLQSTALPVHARRGHASLTRAGNQVLVVGGEIFSGGLGPTATGEVYDRATEIFNATGDLRQPRDAPGAFALADGTVLVTGGANVGVDPIAFPSKAQRESEQLGSDGHFHALPDVPLLFGRADVVGIDVFGRAMVAGGTHRDGRIQAGDERRTPLYFVMVLENP